MKTTSFTALFLMWVLCFVPLYAQETIEQMNEIKLSGAYLTAEVTSSDTEQAFSSALLTLVDKTNQLRSEQGRGAASEAQVRAKVKRLDIPRGSSTMVFVYLAKAEVGALSVAAGSSSAMTASSGDSSSASASTDPSSSSASASAGSSSSSACASAGSSSSSASASAGNSSSSASASAGSSSSSASAVASSTGGGESSVVVSSESSSSSFSYVPTVSAESSRLIAQVKEAEVFSSVAYLLRQHAYDDPSFVYGRADKVGNTDNCYVVLVNEKRYVVALLTPSSNGVRNNVKTMQPCSISDYPGCAAIYFRAK